MSFAIGIARNVGRDGTDDKKGNGLITVRSNDK
ncbi:hypothetical protein K3495_g10900 [Podosphaera aphanis]|nr:hypothetical protein K3495_g10900 [Podosphaera aphanis]